MKTDLREREGNTAPGVSGRRGRAVVLVEAEDRETAYHVFQAVWSHNEPAPGKLTELAPGLFFLRASPSGKYWTFSGSATT